MPQTSIRRVLGLTAAAALALTTGALPLGDGTARAETAEARTAQAGTAWSVSTDAPGALHPLAGGGFVIGVPLNVCAVEWTVIGAAGGAGSDAVAGEAGGELRVTSRGTAGQTFYAFPGAVGQDWSAGAAGGANGADAAGGAGTSDGAGGGGGGGGGGSSLQSAAMHYLVAHGGDGGGVTGGAGGSRYPGPSGNSVSPPYPGTPLAETTFDGSTGEPGGSGRNGAGVISGVGILCPASAPGAPIVVRSGSGPEDGAIHLEFVPGVPFEHEVWSAVTGWEVTLDGGVTWTALPSTARSSGHQEAVVRDVPAGDHRVAVRATSASGPGSPSAVSRVRASPPGAPHVMRLNTGPEEGAIYVGLERALPRAHEVWGAVTGWEITLDGGVTWVALPTTARPDGRHETVLRGLANGEYQVAVRATSAIGPGTPSALRTIWLIGAPTGISVSDVSVSAGVSSLRVSWTPSEGPVTGFVAESYDAAQDGENIPFALCETPPGVHSCVLAAEPGRSYRVVVSNRGRAAPPVTSGVVASPPVPARLPESSGALRVGAGGAGVLTAGDVVDISGSGYLPRSTVTVVVYSTPTVLDGLVTKADGSFDTDVTLPADLPEGAHTLVATGVAPDGRTWTLTQPILAGKAPGAGGPTASVAGGSPAAGTGTPLAEDGRPPADEPTAARLANTGVGIALPVIGGLTALAVGVALLFAGHRGRTVR